MNDDVRQDDHARGCEGRCYTCTCGYDDRVQAALDHLTAQLTEANARIEALTAAMVEAVDRALAEPVMMQSGQIARYCVEPLQPYYHLPQPDPQRELVAEAMRFAAERGWSADTPDKPMVRFALAAFERANELRGLKLVKDEESGE